MCEYVNATQKQLQSLDPSANKGLFTCEQMLIFKRVYVYMSFGKVTCNI